MKKLLIVVAVLITAATFYSALWYKSETIEADIETRVTKALVEDDDYAAAVDVDGRHVTLSGVIYDEATEARYLGIADDTYGALGPIDGLTFQADSGYVNATKTDSGITLSGTVPTEDARAELIANAAAATDGEVRDQLIIGGPAADWQVEAAFGVTQMSGLASGTMIASASGYALSGQPHGDAAELSASFADRDGWQTFIAAPLDDGSADEEITRLTTDLETSRADIGALQAEVADSETTAQSLEAQLSSVQESASLVEAEVTEKEAQILVLNAEIDDLSLSNTSLADELASSARRLSGADTLIASLSSNIDGQSGEATALTDRIAELETDLAGQNTAVGATQEQVVDLRGQLDGANGTIATLTTDVSERDGTIADLTTDVERLTSETVTLSASLEALEQTANIAESEQVSALNANIADLSEQVATRDATIGDLNATIANTNAELNRVTQNLATRDDTIAGLEAEEAASAEEIQGALAALNEQIEQRDTTIEELNASLAQAASQMEGLSAELEDRGVALADQSTQVATLTAAIAASEANTSALRETIGSLETDVSERDVRVSTLQDELDDLTTTVAERDVSISDLQGRLETAAQESRAQTDALSEQVETGVAELATLQGEVSGLAAIVADRDETIAVLQFQSQTTASRADQCAAQASAVMEGSRINFGSATAQIEQNSVPLLERLTGIALACVGDDLVVAVGGHTDAQGTDAVNQELSEARAAAIVTFMVERGVSASGLQAVGFGESQPIADNDTPAGRAENRRISFDWQAR